MIKLLFIVCSLYMISTSAFADKLITVNAEGKYSGKPDIAFVSLSIRTKQKNSKLAQEKNSSEFDRINKILNSEFKIESKDFKTESYSVNPEYNYLQNGKRVFLGVSVNHVLSIKFRDLNKVGALLDKLTVNGQEADGEKETMVEIHNVRLDFEKPELLTVKALESAMEIARDKAKAIAKFYSLNITSVSRVVEAGSAVMPVYREALGKAARPMMADAMASGSSVAQGEVETTANITVEFEAK